jgi:predicted deacylase
MSSLPPGMASTGTASPPVVSVIGYSVQRRPIEMRRFGDGAHPVLIMGAIHGSETGAATLAHGFAEELAKHPELTSGVPVVVIPIANPDGYAAQTRVNANKVDLNRNFPASNWNTHARRPNNFGGQSSASEPETIALMQTIEQLQPRLIISIHSMENPCNNYDGPAQHIAEVMSRYNGFPPTPTIGYPTPGSLGAWAGIDRKIPMITLELPRTTFDAKMWTSNRDAISAAISMVK